MNTKHILLTGDDGYNAIGTRLLVHLLRDEFDLAIAGTRSQQSGVGGLINVKFGGKYGEARVDGVPAVWVEGSPVDAVLTAKTYFSDPFDLTISGMNLGINASADVLSSGTFSAAHRAVVQGVSPYAIAVSYDIHYSHYQRDHNGVDPFDAHVAYPGTALREVIRLAVAQKCWGAKLLNINFPSESSNEIRFTAMWEDTFDYWPPVVLDKQAGRFLYPLENPKDRAHDLQYDTTAVARGYISVTPVTLGMTDMNAYAKVRHTSIKLAI